MKTLLATLKCYDHGNRILAKVLEKLTLWKMMDMRARPDDLVRLCSLSDNISLLEEYYLSITEIMSFSTDVLFFDGLISVHLMSLRSL